MVASPPNAGSFTQMTAVFVRFDFFLHHFVKGIFVPTPSLFQALHQGPGFDLTFAVSSLFSPSDGQTFFFLHPGPVRSCQMLCDGASRPSPSPPLPGALSFHSFFRWRFSPFFEDCFCTFILIEDSYFRLLLFS